MKNQALQYLRSATDNSSAEFREGQWECIDAILHHKRLLVVQRTGWGKSMVYFIATRLLREQNAGPTILISPLLSLMRNQIAAAARLDLVADTINSNNTEDWDAIARKLLENKIDILMISPERLANESFRSDTLQKIAQRIGFFVVDEAHCISDWGHEFRPDYRRIARVLQALPPNLPVLATTATANNRVVSDISDQLNHLSIIRGPLHRNSLILQTISMPSLAVRLAWLADVLPTLPGSGIIYTLTIRDAERVTRWLKRKGIPVESYHAKADTKEDPKRRVKLEDMLLNNEVKALVATVALGMGFDKPDLGFVIHFQRPGSVVHYYQQVGRAGRSIRNAYGVLLGGEEDREISDYFIQSAFPPQAHVDGILKALDAATDGLSIRELETVVNLRHGHIEKALTLLTVEDPSPIVKLNSKYYSTANRYCRDQERIDTLTQIRTAEQAEMTEYLHSTRCLMQFLSRSLDDPLAKPCGRCAVCSGKPPLPVSAPPALIHEASVFLKRSFIPIEPRKQWPSGDSMPVYGFTGRIKPEWAACEGRALSLWGDAGWGEIVRSGKYDSGRFSDELVDACHEMLSEWNPDPSPRMIVPVPSLKHPDIVLDFATRLAAKTNLPLNPCVRKIKENQPQKQMENSSKQTRNLDGVFALDPGIGLTVPVLLVDDMIDSGWTFTVISALLRRAGCPAVYPMALSFTRPN